MKWIFKGINYFLVGAIYRLFPTLDRSAKVFVHFFSMIGVFCLLLFPWLEYKPILFLVVFWSFYTTIKAWEGYYSKSPKKAKEERVYTTEARADPMEFKFRRQMSSMTIKPSPNKKKVTLHRRATIIKK
jgi:hypothetical protein